MNTILKITFFISISIFLFSCQQEVKENPVVQLEAYQKEAKELSKKIEGLERTVAASGEKVYTGLKVPVRIVQLAYEPFSHFFEASGEMETIDEAYVSPEVSGQIVGIFVKEGDRVEKGQKLAKLNTVIIEKNIQELQSQLSLAETVYIKQSALWKKNIGSEIQYLEAKNSYEGLQNKLETLRAQYNLAILTSPIKGIVEKIVQKEGEMATPGMQFMHIVNIDELYVTAQLSEAYLPIIQKGDEVNITLPSMPGFSEMLPVYRTGNVINKENRTFEVQVKINNPQGVMKPNMLANIEINDYNNSKAIVIPSILIRKDLRGSFMYVAVPQEGQTVAKKVYITPGRSFKDKTEVLTGLEAGNIIITDGYNNVSDGAVVEVING
jgi:RND family efflux transporter MFP subunit